MGRHISANAVRKLLELKQDQITVRGDCDLCGEWSSNLVHGECAACRERMRPDPWEQEFEDVPEIPSCTCNFAALILMLMVCGGLLIWWIK